MHRLLYDQNVPSFWQSVIKYWKIAVCGDLYLASAPFLDVEKCAIEGLLKQGQRGHQTCDCTLCIIYTNKNKVAIPRLMVLQFQSNTVN